jgi:hypothetical protein
VIDLSALIASIRLLLIEDKDITGRHVLPDLRQLRIESVLETRRARRQTRVRVEEHHAGLGLIASRDRFKNHLAVLSAVDERRFDHLSGPGMRLKSGGDTLMPPETYPIRMHRAIRSAYR